METRLRKVAGSGAALLLALLLLMMPVQVSAAGTGTGSVSAVYGEGGAGARKVTVRMQTFTESNKELKNPDRGFYVLYGFVVTDDYVDYAARVREYCSTDSESTLALVRINLRNYRDGDISQAGLDNINALLDAWAASGKRLILRFLYDWDGENLASEPESLDTILRHIEQVGPVLKRHAGVIYTLQGLFVGNYGEMHNTKFGSDGDLRSLAQALADAVGDGMYLSVRTPAQWQAVTGQGTDQLAARTGLFNDGMLGSETDLGTYAAAARAEGLAFQEKLCTRVPNGGEVVIDNEYNDFENAVADLAAMHVTYLNQDYDRNVLDKWKAAKVSDRSCFNGMNGLEYIRRHLGYRLLVDKVTAAWKRSPQGIGVSVDFRNVGFAPLYTSPEVTLVLKRRGAVFAPYSMYPMDHELTALTGGNNASATGTAQVVIPLEDLFRGSYEVYMDLKDPVTGMPVLLANEQERGDDGYFLGTLGVAKNGDPVLPDTGGTDISTSLAMALGPGMLLTINGGIVQAAGMHSA